MIIETTVIEDTEKKKKFIRKKIDGIILSESIAEELPEPVTG